MSRTRRCDRTIRKGRLAKAIQFLDAAELVREFANDDHQVADVYVTLCVHAGIAASDVVCCARLGVHAQGEDHQGAISMLASADDSLSSCLRICWA